MKTIELLGIILFIIISTILFVIIQPGAIFMIPGQDRWIEFGVKNWKQTAIHTSIYFLAMSGLMVFYVLLIYPLASYIFIS